MPGSTSASHRHRSGSRSPRRESRRGDDGRRRRRDSRSKSRSRDRARSSRHGRSGSRGGRRRSASRGSDADRRKRSQSPRARSRSRSPVRRKDDREGDRRSRSSGRGKSHDSRGSSGGSKASGSGSGSDSGSGSGSDSRARSKSKKSKKSKKKKKKGSKRRRDSSGSGSRSRSASPDLSGLSEKERRKVERKRKREAKARRRAEREAKKAAKKALKKKETPRERAARKAAKKKKLQEVYFGYTNEDNPFGDSNLTKPFVWGKKLQADAKKSGGKVKAMSKRDFRKQQLANLAQIEKVKERRRLREIEEEERERLRQEEISLREAELYGDFEKKEKEFQKANAKAKTRIRIKDGRERPVDMLVKNLLILDKEKKRRAREAGELGSDEEDSDEDATGMGGEEGEGGASGALEVEVQEPYLVMQGLPVSELEELRADITQYAEVMQEDEQYASYWRDLAICCDDALQAAKAEDAGKPRYDASLPASLVTDIAAMFDNKDAVELEGMRAHVESMARKQGNAAQGAAYWKAVKEALEVNVAKARLREFHEQVLLTRLQQIEADAAKQALTGGSAGAGAGAGAGAAAASGAVAEASAWDSAEAGGAAGSDDDGDLSPALEADDEDGDLSPALEPDSDDEGGAGAGAGGGRAAGPSDAEVIDEEEDRRRLMLQRKLILEREGGSGAAAGGAGGAGAAPGGPLARDEALMAGSDEVQLARDEAYMWQDKYRPRKPRYFNRVKTGYDWNKYNQMHYDHDNPPPKTVQGYKFNIFYPDLIDRTQPPTFFLEPADTPEFCIIRFHAGPPYEDIAFKIVNGEWEKSHRRGFKSVFQRGILNLYFNFKRFRYRR